MSHLRGRVTAAGVLVLVVLGFFGWGLWQRWDSAEIAVPVANVSGSAQVVRVIDATSGRILGTVQLEDGVQATVARHRLDVWWRDTTIPEKAAGINRGIRVEVLGSGCGLLAAEVVDAAGDSVLTISPEDGLMGWVPGPPARSIDVAPAALDPCDGRPAPPVAVVLNPLTDPVVLEGRIRVEACSTLTVRQGDAAVLLPAVELAGAAAIDVASLAIQKGHWPAEPRSVVVGSEEGGSAIVDPSRLDRCRANLGAIASP